MPSAIHADSAGVDLVLNPAIAGEVPVFATFDSLPSLTLGSLSGSPEEQFGSVVDVEPLPNGGVAILDGQAAQIRVFAEDGSFVTTLGTRGDGPGELRTPIAIGLVADDTLAVFDRRTTRVTRFPIGGGPGRVTSLAAEDRMPIRGAVIFPDGRLVVRSRWTASEGGAFTPPPEGQPTLVRDTSVLSVYLPDGAPLDPIAVVPNQEVIMRLDRDGPALRLFRRAAVFGRAAVFQAHPDGVWSGANDRFVLRLHDGLGRLVRVVRAPGLERPATEEMGVAIREDAMATSDQNPEQIRYLEGWFETSPTPELLPAYDRIVVDPEARLWVREWSAPAPSGRWWVFSRTGDLLGFADAPPGSTLYAVGCRSAWATLRGEFDVTRVVRYSVDAPGSDSGICAGGAGS